MLVAPGFENTPSVIPNRCLVDVEPVGNVGQSVDSHHEGERGNQSKDGKKDRTLFLKS